jgi:hypothetical protein
MWVQLASISAISRIISSGKPVAILLLTVPCGNKQSVVGKQQDRQRWMPLAKSFTVSHCIFQLRHMQRNNNQVKARFMAHLFGFDMVRAN